MIAALGYLPVPYNKYPVAGTYRRQTVRHDKTGTPAQHLINRFRNNLLRLRINRRCGLVQHEYLWVGQYRPRERYKLLLTGRQSAAALTYARVEPFIKLHNKAIRVNRLSRGDYFVVGCVEPPVTYIILYRAGKQMRALQYIAKARLQPYLRTLAVVHTVYQYLPGSRLVEPANKINNRTLTRAGLAYECDFFTRSYG